MKWNLPFLETHIAGLELALAADGLADIRAITLKKTGSNIEQTNEYIDLESIGQLSQQIDKTCPILLSLKGKGIIHKRVSATAQDSFELLLDKVLPNSNINDFYVQKLAIDQEFVFVSVVRKTVADAVINEFSNLGYSVIACLFGPFAIQSVIPIILPDVQTTSELKFANTELLIRNGLIHNYTTTATAESVQNIGSGSVKLNSELLVAYASAFTYFNPIGDLSSNLDTVQFANDEFKDALRFKKTGAIVLGIFFAILLVNFVLFSHYSDAVKQKSALAALSSSELTLIDSLSGQIEQRAMFLSKTGLSSPSRTSFYADAIAQSLPEEIRLTSLQIHPQKKDEDNEAKMEFEGQKILIRGSSKYSLDVNEWIRKMRKCDWVKSISLLTYKQKDGSKPGEFLIEIKLK